MGGEDSSLVIAVSARVSERGDRRGGVKEGGVPLGEGVDGGGVAERWMLV